MEAHVELAAAAILGVKRQTINNRLKANKLLAVKVGGEYRLPIFQFDGNRLVDGLDDILILLDSLSSTTKVSFLTSMYFLRMNKILMLLMRLKIWTHE